MNSTCVSIPYGSIKSCRTSSSSRRVTVFQFLMVRLKAAASTTGVIIHSWFQFLMVRLKGNTANKLQVLWRVSIPYGSIKSSVSVSS